MKACFLIAGLIVVATLSGCSTGYESGAVAREWGTSHNLAVANQTLNPDAEKNLKPVTGMENKAAENTITKYEKEFEKAPRAPVYNLQLPSSLGTANTGTHY